MVCAKTIVLGIVAAIIIMCFLAYMLALAPALTGFLGGLALVGLLGITTGWTPIRGDKESARL